MYHVFTKPGCSFCTDAERLLGERGIEYVAVKCTDAEDARSKLGVMAPPFTTFPVIIDAQGRYVGGYIQLRDTLTEPLLQPSLTRFSAFPIEYEHIYELYKRAISCFWTADEITLAQDATDFQTLTADEQHFVKYVLAFFASSDGIVNENLMGNFSKEIQISEARSFYAFQAFNEAEHNRTYGMLIDSLVTDLDERDRLFNAITEIPAVQRKAEWALTWLDPATRSFAERLVAFLCVEGILFSGSFCAIFWLKRAHPGLLPGLSLSNQFIARDEALHCEHAAALYNCLVHKLTHAQVHAIVGEAVENEKQFITDAVPCTLIGMNPGLMGQYIEFVADSLMADIGYPPLYGTKNPFAWMEAISLEGKTNFFESRVSEYARAGISKGGAASGDQSFCTDDDF